jgi:uncharacterized coiled-coil protein SlyX
MSESFHKLQAQKSRMLAKQDFLTVEDGDYLRERLAEAAGQERTIKELRAQVAKLRGLLRRLQVIHLSERNDYLDSEIDAALAEGETK